MCELCRIARKVERKSPSAERGRGICPGSECRSQDHHDRFDGGAGGEGRALTARGNEVISFRRSPAGRSGILRRGTPVACKVRVPAAFRHMGHCGWCCRRTGSVHGGHDPVGADGRAGARRGDRMRGAGVGGGWISGRPWSVGVGVLAPIRRVTNVAATCLPNDLK